MRARGGRIANVHPVQHADGSDAVRAVEKLGKQRGTRRSSFLTEEVVLATAGEGR